MFLKLYPAESEVVGGVRTNLAALQAQQQKWDEAYATGQTALKTLEKALGPQHP